MYGRSLSTSASAEFFQSPTLGRYLRGVGALPNNHPRLLPLLATEILQGRKIVIFPEGGMAKDRQVLDQDGQFSVYSRTAQTRRKHHSGAAVLAQMLDSFKTGLLADFDSGGSLARWADSLAMTKDVLETALRRPTRLVPGNITFYPLRVDEIVRRFSEHEGVMLFRHNQSEHPDINYANIPIHALNELRHMIDALPQQLPMVRAPTVILQGDNDPVVDASSALLIEQHLTGARWVRRSMIGSERHGILNEDIGETRKKVQEFLDTLCFE